MTLPAVLDFVGVSVFAVSGALAAGRKQLDFLGVIVLALATAIGGGTIRDVLLGRHPIFWLENQAYILVIVASALLTIAYTRWRRPPHQALQIADALGLALFSITGAQIAERMGLPAVSGVVLGTITGSAGGMVRDVLSAEIPMVLRPGSLYATAAIAGTSIYFVMERLGALRPLPALTGMAVIAVIRLAAILWRLQLPVFKLDSSTEKP
ncbi:MAG: trimeric intracellular cation channel family protein [Gemmatimonadaceae bacterium]